MCFLFRFHISYINTCTGAGVKRYYGHGGAQAGKEPVKWTPQERMEKVMSENSKPLTHKVPEFARLMDVAVATVYSQVAKGAIPHIRIGKAIRIPCRVSEKLLEEAEGK